MNHVTECHVTAVCSVIMAVCIAVIAKEVSENISSLYETANDFLVMVEHIGDPTCWIHHI